MHRSLRFLVVFALLALAFAACGGGTSGVPAPSDAGASADAGTTSDSAAGDAGPLDGATPVDAATAGPNAGRVSCGAVECTREGDGRSREICCVTPGAPPKMTCTKELDEAACDQGERECDDTADCGNQVCCAETTDDGKMSTRCMATCITGVPRWQLCKSSAECEGGVPCTMGICPKQGIAGFCVGAEIPRGCE